MVECKISSNQRRVLGPSNWGLGDKNLRMRLLVIDQLGTIPAQHGPEGGKHVGVWPSSLTILCLPRGQATKPDVGLDGRTLGELGLKDDGGSQWIVT